MAKPKMRCDMKKRTNLIFLIFPLIWAFYFIFMKGHILHWESTDFFVRDWGYSQQFLLKPGGWGEYLSHFVLQYFQWPWLGALILTLLLMAIFVSAGGIARYLAIAECWPVLEWLPVILTGGLLCNSGISFLDMLHIFLFFFILWGILSAPLGHLRTCIAVLFFPCLYLLLPWGVVLMFYLTFLFVHLRKSKNRKGMWIPTAGIVLVGIWPYLWRRWVWVMPEGTLFPWVTFPEGERVWAWWLIYGYGMLLWLISFWFNRKQFRNRKQIRVLNVIALVLIIVGFYVVSRQKETEYFYRMDQAVEAGDWEKVLRIAGQLDRFEREELYFVSLALAMRGELGEKLFEYPVWGSGCLYLPRDLDYKNSILGAELYYRLKVPNEAIHWTFQASVASPLGMDFRVLKRLIDLNIQKRDLPVARKYLSILEKANCYTSWCRSRRKMLHDPDTDFVESQEEHDFFIGGRPFLSDMARLIDAGRSKKLALDYVLCGLLLNKDLQKFCQLFVGFYPYQRGEQLPAAYEEALLVAQALGWKIVCEKEYVFSQEVSQKYQEYNALLETCGKDKEQNKKIMEGYRTTWWYYFHFVDLRLMDERGHIFNGYSS